MAHFLFNCAEGDRGEVSALLRANMWGIGEPERHREAIVEGNVVLVYLAPEGAFIGRAEVASPVHEWTPSEADAYPGDSPSGVLLSDGEEWDPAVPMQTVVQRLDPTGSESPCPSERRARLPDGRGSDHRRRIDTAVAISREARGT